MKEIGKFIKAHKGFFIFLFSAIIIKSFADLQLPKLLGDIVNSAIIQHDFNYIVNRGGIMVLVSAVSGGCALAITYFSAKISSSYGRDTRAKVYEKIQGFSQREFDRFGTASLITRSTNDIQRVQGVIMSLLRTVLTAPFICIGGIVMAVITDWRLSVILAIVVPVLFGIKFMVAKINMPLFKLMQLKMDEMNRVIREKIIGIRVIHGFNKEAYEQDRFNRHNEDFCSTNIHAQRIVDAVIPITMLITNITTIVIAWLGAKSVLAGHTGVGNLVAFIQYAGQVFSSISIISMMFTMIPRAIVSYQRINRVLETETEIKSPKEPKEPKGTEIEFVNVSFHYDSNKTDILRNISFKAKEGEITAIIGSTGSGKTSVLSLIQRFYDVTAGEIKIGGVNVKQLALEKLRKLIGYIPQNAVLFTGSVRENVGFGCDAPTEKQMWEMLAVAQGKDFVADLSNGLDHQISRGGKNLSGGQKQRISIARACMIQPHIFLMDDCFSALDFITDKRCREAMEPILSKATTIIVAQRVNTIQGADKIIVLDEGKIVGEGTHEELLTVCRPYMEIVKSQMDIEVQL